MSTVCMCKHVSKETIEKALHEGADSMEKVKMATGATGGACKGARCGCQVQEMINTHKKA